MMDCPVVETSLGKVKGLVVPKAKCSNAKDVFQYSRIPFAKPPVGELRFEPPQKAEKWDGVLDGTQSIPSPIQDPKMVDKILKSLVSVKVSNEDQNLFSEDCLYLNVFTPNASSTANLPVMFWIFGGGFQMGGSPFYNGQVLCGIKDVVLVVPNYRVNTFGFLDLGKDTKWGGNMGLMDQVMALQWTKENIKNFGGNPDNVTIFGESAGSISVGLQIVSPMSRGLFHKAISHSGNANFPTLTDGQSETLKLMLTNLNITDTEPEAIMRKLKSLPYEDILNGLDAEKYQFFSPTSGNDFLPEPPNILLQKGDFAPVPYIIGCNNTEGYGLLCNDFPPGFAEGYDRKTMMDMSKGMLALSLAPDKLDSALKKIEKKFDGVFPADDKQRWSKILGSIIAETWFVAPAVQQAQAHAGKGHRTYMYLMTHRMKWAHEEEFCGGLKLKPDFCEADHGDDVTLTLGEPFANGVITPPVKFSEEEEELSKLWIDYITNFAKTGNPNQGVEVPIEWPQYDSTSRRHLLVRNPFSVGEKLIADRYDFWMDTVCGTDS